MGIIEMKRDGSNSLTHSSTRSTLATSLPAFLLKILFISAASRGYRNKALLEMTRN